MSQSKKRDDKRNVVIVGGGYGGVHAARALSSTLDASKYSLFLINSRPYSIFLPATLRMVVSDKDKLENAAMLPYDKVFVNGNGTFIHDSVVAIRPGTPAGEIELRGGEKMSYDVLVLATGSLWDGPLAFPIDADEVTQFVASLRTKFEKAAHIVLAGGGAVGTELAGEIKDIWPDKSVTIVHREAELMNDTYPEKFRQNAKTALESRGVRLIFDDTILNIPRDGSVHDGKLTTTSGKSIPAEYAVQTWGGRPNTSMIASSLGPDTLTQGGLVKIKPTLQLLAHSNIFAIGDIINWEEQKQAAKAKTHAALASKNIVTFLNDKSAPLTSYKGSYEMIVVTNGKAGGIAYFGVLWGIVLGSWFAVLVKSKTVLLPMFRGLMGY